MRNLKKMILGEKMPDKDDPQYRDKYEKDLQAGRKFAKATGIDRLVGHIQKFAGEHQGLFLGIVFAIVIGCFALNIYHFTKAYRLRKEYRESSGIPAQQIRNMVENVHAIMPIQEKEDGTDKED